MTNLDKEILFVAGGGARVKTSSVMFTFMRRYADAKRIPYNCVDGTHVADDGQLYISPASKQLEQIESAIESLDKDKKLLIVAQCLGTVASLTAIEKSQNLQDEHSSRLNLLSIAPPLPSPESTLQTPRSMSKRTTGMMETWDLPADGSLSIDTARMTLYPAIIPDSYLKEHIAVSDSFSFRFKRQLDMGKALVCSPLADWNAASAEVTQSWEGNGVLCFDNAGHSLNPRTSNMPYDQVLLGQEANAKRALDFGLSLL